MLYNLGPPYGPSWGSPPDPPLTMKYMFFQAGWLADWLAGWPGWLAGLAGWLGWLGWLAVWLSGWLAGWA